MAERDMELPEGVRPIMISKPNFELLLREGRSFEEYFRFEEGDAVAAKEEEVLNADTGPDEPGEESLAPAEETGETEEEPETPSEEIQTEATVTEEETPAEETGKEETPEE